MPLVCPRCCRSNPEEAVFCHFDGAELRPGHAAVDPRYWTRLPHAFVFPTGRCCWTFDELAQGCQEEWETARDLLREGVLQEFLSHGGRLDLGRLAQQAAAQRDADVALETFIAGLPASQTKGPQLDLQPRRLILGTLRPGQTSQANLVVMNQGKGLLHGTVTVAGGGDWLRLSSGPEKGSDPLNKGSDPFSGPFAGPPLDTDATTGTIKTVDEQTIVLNLNTQGLSAPQGYHARLTLITNGGIVEVPVYLELAAIPFAQAPFQRVVTPRQLAERMRAQPRAAIPLLESGAVARWFEANGWIYPVSGPTAPGMAAVQQFFEGLGLTRPPAVQLVETEAQLTCLYPETVAGRATLRTAARKWIYARAESDVHWLRVPVPVVSGPRQAVIPYEVDSSLLDADRVHEGTLHVVANAGQARSLRVRVDVRQPEVPFTRRLLRPFLVAAFAGLVLRLLLAGPADGIARALAAPATGAAPGSFDGGRVVPNESDFVRQFVLATWWLGAPAGAVVLWRRGSPWADVGCGIVAGAATGVIGSAVLACLLPWLDGLPRWLWQQLADAVTPLGCGSWAALGTLAWIVLATACWAGFGALLGLGLACLGRPGLHCLSRAVEPMAWFLRLCGWDRLAALCVFE